MDPQSTKLLAAEDSLFRPNGKSQTTEFWQWMTHPGAAQVRSTDVNDSSYRRTVIMHGGKWMAVFQEGNYMIAFAKITITFSAVFK